MADGSEQRQTEKIEAAARRRAAYGEVTRVRSRDDGDTEYRSRYDANLSVPTLPASIIDSWAGSDDNADAGGTDGEQGTDTPPARPSSNPSDGQQSNNR